MERALRTVRFALRSLHRARTFTTVAVATLAAAIGANAVTFALIKSVLINPLPYRDPDRLVTIVEADGRAPYPDTLSPGTFSEVRRRTTSFEAMSLYGDASIRPTDGGRPDFIRGMRVSANFFTTLGVPMLLGRGFAPDDELPSRAHVVVLAYGTWAERFGGDRGIIGRSIPTLAGPYTVVGVTTPDFVSLHMTNAAELPRMFIPLGFDVDRNECRSPSCRYLRGIGRLKRGVSARHANEELHSVAGELRTVYPADYPTDFTISATGLRDQLVGRFGMALWMLEGVALLLLLLGCANVAMLLLARLTARQRELALRMALGAHRSHLVGELLTENVIIASAAAAGGVVIAWAAAHAIAMAAETNLPRLAELSPDVSMLGLAIAAAFATVIAFGVAPVTLTLGRIARCVSGSFRAAVYRPDLKTARLLVGVEVALAMVLVAIVGLLSKSYVELTRLNLGYDWRNVLTLSLLPSGVGDRIAYFDAVTARVRAIPGVQDAAYASTLPLSHPTTSLLYIREQPLAHNADAPNLTTYLVSTNYLDVMRIPVKRGRGFAPSDTALSEHVAVISESTARRMFGSSDPIGQHIQLDQRNDARPWAVILGVVGDVHQYGVETPPDSAVYVPFEQYPVQSWVSLVVRSAISTDDIESAVRAAMVAVDPNQPIFHLQPMSRYLALSMAQRSFALRLVATVGVLALVLSFIGVYSVTSYVVEHRRRDVAIRLALGATSGSVMGMIGGQVMRTAAAGMIVGFTIIAACTRLIATFLFNVSAIDAQANGAVAGIILAATAAAVCGPLFRLLRVDPAVTLRTD